MEIVFILLIVGIFMFYMAYMCLGFFMIVLLSCMVFVSEMWEGFISLFRKKTSQCDVCRVDLPDD
jgi:hypothetical protein